MRRFGLLKRACAGLVILLLCACQPAPTPEVTDAWLRAPLPGKSVAAGYFTLNNRADRPVTLVALSSPDAARVELHTHRLDGDMMRMRKLNRLTVAGGDSAALTPGGRHLMLFDVDLPSDSTPVTLEFADGSVLRVQFDVRSPTP